MRNRTRNQKGYTLVEALVVVGIIGLVSVVTIPNFISLYRSNKIKGSARQFTQDLRTARQISVTEYMPMKISFNTGVGAGSYTLFQGDFDSTEPDGISWTVYNPNGVTPAPWPRTMDDEVYFASTQFKDTPDDANDAKDIVFMNNGKILWTSDHVTTTTAETQNIVIRTTMNVPRDEYEVTVTQAGRIRTP